MIDLETYSPKVIESKSSDCALMANLYGSLGDLGPVLKITARKRVGHERSFAECIQKGPSAAYGDSWVLSLGGTFDQVRKNVLPYHAGLSTRK
ncbi:hypothetical protein BDV34DRAFT_190056 [Aspergillus parasiticus]|uniref:DUF1907 domain-containing protein n=1 Tax=Aspergillus parasiticus TaxID=5067 RepID=A0A5N6DUR6_ASPPA|nr:hypothetical protein BDV34DRAFT_190056 [Aspergillus parasiticus]